MDINSGQPFSTEDFSGPPEDRRVEELHRVSAGIQEFMSYVEGLPDLSQRETVSEGLRLILRFHCLGLERMLDLLSDSGAEAGSRLLNHLVEDNFVSGLLLIHQLHPLDCRSRLLTALEKVRPYIESHGGKVELVRLTDGVASLRMSGSCSHCVQSPATLELAIRQMVEDYCPDLSELEVERVMTEAETNPETEERPQPAQWYAVCLVESLGNGIPHFCDMEGIQLMVCRTEDYINAYRNLCPACGMPLSTGSICGDLIQCTLGHSFDLQRAGLCTDDGELRLEPFPLMAENGTVKVAIRGGPKYHVNE